MKRNTAFIWAAGLFFCLAITFPTQAAEEGEGDTAKDALAADLEDVRNATTAAYEEISSLSAELAEEQHKLEYKNPEISGLYKDIKALEKELLEKREALKAHLRSSPGIREIERKRAELFKRIQELQEQERLILNEIELAEENH